jgi:hypothetical protein
MHKSLPRRPNSRTRQPAKPHREEFLDGSAMLTYPDGSQVILESDLAKSVVGKQGCKTSYNAPPPRRRRNSLLPEDKVYDKVAARFAHTGLGKLLVCRRASFFPLTYIPVQCIELPCLRKI